MRLIDADMLLGVIPVINSKGQVTSSTIPAMDILKAPTIDAVPVVRCKDCKYRNTEQCAMSFIEFTTGKLFSRESDIDFCSKSKRREP